MPGCRASPIPERRSFAPRSQPGVAVTVLPGPSAVETALVASGLAAERYAFVGFLPRRATELAALWDELAVWRGRSWRSSRRGGSRPRCGRWRRLQPERAVAVCRELTKRFEQVERGSAAELAARFAEAPKGRDHARPRTGRRPASTSRHAAEAARAVAELVAAGTPRKVAAEVVSRLTGVSRNDLYRVIFVTRL